MLLPSNLHSLNNSIVAVAVIHPFAEHIAYFLLFSLPFFTTIYMKNISILSVVVYFTYIDFMNNMGHCNFEYIPKQLFSTISPLKYFMYTPS